VRMPFRHYFDKAEEEVLSIGVTPQQLETLKRYGLFARDNVTGYYEARSGIGRFQTLVDAIAHVRDTQEECYYVEIDVRNLSGLNSAIGHTGANVIFRAITDALEARLTACASEVVCFRHGGDELSMVVVNTKLARLDLALHLARLDVELIAQKFNVAFIHCPKIGGRPGIGIHQGIARIEANSIPETLFVKADEVLCADKRHKNVEVVILVE